jgi:hypothetical protein
MDHNYSFPHLCQITTHKHAIIQLCKIGKGYKHE